MRVFSVSNFQTYNKVLNFKSKKNDTPNLNNDNSQKSIKSVDPKVLALAMAIATMTPSFSSNTTNESLFEKDTNELIDSNLGYELRDSAFNTALKDDKFFYYQLSDLILSDSARIEKRDKNHYDVSVVLANKKIDFSLKSNDENFKELTGVAKVYNETEQNKVESVYKFSAKIDGARDINIQLQDPTNKKLDRQEFLLHRNHNDKLYMINKKNNEIIELNKSFTERLEDEISRLEKESDEEYTQDLEKDIITHIILALVFGVGIGASLGSKFSNKNNNHN